jgi:hypothetical protein
VNAIGPNEPANGVHPNQISTWKRAAIDHMATAFTRRGSEPGKGNEAEIEKLHSKIGQLVVERDFLANGLSCKPPLMRWMAPASGIAMCHVGCCETANKGSHP